MEAMFKIPWYYHGAVPKNNENRELFCTYVNETAFQNGICTIICLIDRYDKI